MAYILLFTGVKILNFLFEWHKERATQEIVKREIQNILNKDIPKSYDREVFSDKTEVVFRHFYELAEMGRGFAA